jgi:DNA-binding NarL/FixJ family response regulator
MTDSASTLSAHGPQDAFSTLSPRELAVLERLASGCSNRVIADELEITVNTVKFHLASIYRKLAVDNRTEASVAFVRHLATLAPYAAEKGL